MTKECGSISRTLVRYIFTILSFLSSSLRSVSRVSKVAFFSDKLLSSVLELPSSPLKSSEPFTVSMAASSLGLFSRLSLMRGDTNRDCDLLGPRLDAPGVDPAAQGLGCIVDGGADSTK